MENEKQFVIPAGVNVLEYLIKKDIFISAPCGGQGTCGKCRIKLLAGALPPGEADKALLSPDEIDAGMRLACKAAPATPVRISLITQKDSEYNVAGDYITHDALKGSRHRGAGFDGANVTPEKKLKEPERRLSPEDAYEDHEYGIALDLGTTTIAAELIDITLDKRLLARTSVNRQRVFGADVVSRVQAAMAGRGEELKRIVEKDICGLLKSMDIPAGIKISKLVISGNTAMYHLLMEYDVKGIAFYPFKPVSLGGGWLTRDEVFTCCAEDRKVLPGDCRICLMPGLSAFVGGDIFSGIYATGLIRDEDDGFLIDIGTNAEMVLKKGDRYFTASAAAGPALEGGNLKWGTGSVAGAISGVKIRSTLLGTDDVRADIKTISDAPPVGICGTGAVEAVFEMLQAGMIDKYGTFAEKYREHGFPLAKSPMGEIIGLDQNDIRQIQMAKAAIMAGIEELMSYAGIRPEEIGRVYVSGGFGSFLDMKKASGIGLLPDTLAEKACLCGNTSLYGARMALSEDTEEAYKEVAGKAELADLADNESFKNRYIECMNF